MLSSNLFISLILGKCMLTTPSSTALQKHSQSSRFPLGIPGTLLLVGAAAALQCRAKRQKPYCQLTQVPRCFYRKQYKVVYAF